MFVSANILEKKYRVCTCRRANLFLILYLWFTGQGSDFNRSCPRNGNYKHYRVSNKILG